jgi:L-amino acid N-acyltransferase YncA
MNAPTIRVATAADAAAMLAIYAPLVRDTTISFETDPPSEDEFRDRVRRTSEWAPWLVAETEGRLLGYAYASRFRSRAAYDWTVEVTVYVHADARGRGVGRALYDVLLRVLRLQRFHRVLAAIALPNPASVALHERLGFTHAGTFKEVGRKFGRWHDVGFWELPLADTPDTQERPRTLAEVLPLAGLAPPGDR